MSIRVLLADDDLDFLDVTAYALRRAGFAVDTASDGNEALKCWNEDEHDIVLLDVNMPIIEGIQVCQQIRNTSSVPVRPNEWVIVRRAKSSEDSRRGRTTM